MNSMSNLSKCNETTSCHHNVITNSNNNNSASTTTTNTTNNSIPSSNCTFNLFSSSFPCSKDKIDNMNIISPNTHIAHNHPHHHHHHQHSSCTASKTMFSSLSSSSNCCGCCCYCSCSISSTGVSGSSGIGGGSGSNNSFTFCPTSYYSCSCYVCRINNQSQHPGVGAAAGSSTLASSSQYCLPAKRACRSTSSSSDLPYYTSSLLSSSSSVCGYYSYHRQCHLPQRHCHQCCPKSIINNNNNATMIRSMQSYIKNLPRPIAVRLDSQTMMASVSSQVKYNNTNSNNNAISNPSTVPNDTSSGDSQLIMSADNSQPPVQKSIRLRNHHTTRANEQQQQRTTSVRPPNYIEIKELQDSSLSAHALPR
ncbi:unnamed protein product [Trichobilharzia regenti]|nr:unnamed protein product [Trichobilharzia regenti]